MQAIRQPDANLVDIARAGNPARVSIEARLFGLTEQVLRERASVAAGRAFPGHREVWGDLDKAYHHIRTALGRVRGES